MFTGIIEEIGQVTDIVDLGDSVRITIKAPKVLEDARLGDSISVSGVCLTVADRNGDFFQADCMQETLTRSSLGTLRVGSNVNLERAMSVQGRFGGHIVQGHVDGVGELLSREHSSNWDVLRISLPEALARYVVEKGSITVHGTSLTVSALRENYFEVSLIPMTLRDTVLGELQVGDAVNLEVDVLAKYVERLLGNQES
ncbi:riboflavin synthase [Corynebacterium freiburgense]|uniref:riboflavin synthase n=1 Tax=Corynebacterium freiburgense TaxID=556548 RepID=UPI000424987C|nr:riboflavin synthase [Corynebacterium freiburgense]WJZ02756.1 Riboflavin synthase [Corynebacterium freiburgense]